MADVLDPMANAMMKAICQGSRVRRNPETWNRGDQDGGDGHQGTVTWCDTAVGRASVLWDVTQVETTHDLSHDGRFELIVTGHEDRWLSAEDFGVGTRVVHDFRGPGVVTAKEKNQNGIPCTRVLFDNGESHAYKEAYFMQGKIVREEDAPKLQPAAEAAKSAALSTTAKKGADDVPVVASYADAQEMSTKIANELRSKGIVIPKASSPEEACELARWLMQQYPKLSPEANAAQPAAAEESAEAAAPEAKEKAAEPNGETAGTLCGVEVVPPGWKPQDDELMHELDELYEAMDQMAKSPRAVQNSRSGSYPSTGLPFAPFHRPAVLPPELQVLTHRLPPILPYAPVYSSPYASPYRPHLPITA